MPTVTTAEFKNNVDIYIDEPLEEPVYITKHGRRIVALINAAELERLITTADNRQSYFIKDLPKDAIAALHKGPQAPARSDLDHLMKDQ